jgi:1,4-alpha-glucan branching enzyme
MYRTAEHWVREYHVDGFRIDAFRDIDNWDFIQQFTQRAHAEHAKHFPDRPFLVVAEDSAWQFQAARDDPGNPQETRVVDAMWSFGYRAEARRFLWNNVTTRWGAPAGPRQSRQTTPWPGHISP